jgi:hypothetical protein
MLEIDACLFALSDEIGLSSSHGHVSADLHDQTRIKHHAAPIATQQRGKDVFDRQTALQSSLLLPDSVEPLSHLRGIQRSCASAITDQSDQKCIISTVHKTCERGRTGGLFRSGRSTAAMLRRFTAKVESSKRQHEL